MLQRDAACPCSRVQRSAGCLRTKIFRERLLGFSYTYHICSASDARSAVVRIYPKHEFDSNPSCRLKRSTLVRRVPEGITGKQPPFPPRVFVPRKNSLPRETAPRVWRGQLIETLFSRETCIVIRFSALWQLACTCPPAIQLAVAGAYAST